jgi:hypothetical protein
MYLISYQHENETLYCVAYDKLYLITVQLGYDITKVTEYVCRYKRVFL